MLQTLPYGFVLALTLSHPFCVAALAAENSDDDAAKLEFFEERIRPVLIDRCYSCHSAQSSSLEGELQLDFRDGLLKGGESGPAVVPNDSQASLLVQALRYEGLEMPPDEQLPENVIRDFEIWVGAGAVDPRDQPSASNANTSIDYREGAEFWAFQPPIARTPPQTTGSDWAKSSIDQFVIAGLDAAGLSPNPMTDRRTLIRRAYLDLIGLPPTPDEIASFEQDTSSTAFETVVNRLLESPHYGERWGRRWLDVARYGEDQAHTFKARNYPRGFRYRDWVIEAFNADMRYDQFLTWQIAGDLLDEPDRNERLAALGLFALGPVYYAENVEQARAAADEWDDRIDTLTRGTLALTVSCARCHDHKFDPVSIEDYYGLAGIFRSSNYQERPIVPDEVVASRRAADQAVAQQQLEVEQFLAQSSRAIRPKLVDQIPEYVVAAWKLRQRRKNGSDEEQLLRTLAEETSLDPTLITRWAAFLTPESARDESETAVLARWLDLIADEKSDTDLSAEPESIAAVEAFGRELQQLVATKAPRRNELFAQFGANAAFVNEADLATVRPGVIPLGNLFDDSKNVSLEAALNTDRFSAAATEQSLGVARAVQGWGTEVDVAAGIRFHFGKLGSSSHSYGAIVNDGWQAGGAIRTRGGRFSSGERQEQGIGMHANALVTFDLDEIRRAGGIPSEQRLRFKVDRAGINDDAIGSNASAFLSVLVSRPQRDQAVTDAILLGAVNGKQVTVGVNDFTYYFSGDVGEPLQPNGQFVSFDIELPADARYITLVTTGAGTPDNNPISSDHTVFSGVRLEFDPLPNLADAVADSVEPTPQDEAARQLDRRDAILLSRMFYDEGLLALSPAESESLFDEQQQTTLGELRDTLTSLQTEAAAIEVSMAHSLTDGNAADLPVYLRGDPASQGEIVPRSIPAIFTGGERIPFATDGSGRLELASALTSDENPLTARVIVNRVWAGHFGTGLVKTTSNFGRLGGRPSHPELLDWLAVRFMEQGWSLKQLHRDIMLSATYQQSSAFQQNAHDVDPENRLLWRMNRRRLEVEPWRDSLLAVSGELDPSIGGPSLDLDNADNKRRTVYGFVSRHRLNELLRLFDFPDPSITSADRSVTTVPLQQLLVLNSDFMARRARALVKRIDTAGGSDDASKIRYAYELLFSREVSSEELEVAEAFVQLEVEPGDRLNRWEQLALALLSANEFMFVD